MALVARRRILDQRLEIIVGLFFFNPPQTMLETYFFCRDNAVATYFANVIVICRKICFDAGQIRNCRNVLTT